MKSYTDLEQSKILAELLPLESADMHYVMVDTENKTYSAGLSNYIGILPSLPCWSLAALLKCIGKIKPQVYTPILFLSEGKWILQFVEYGHGNVCEVSCNNPVDACYEMILKLSELKML